MGLLSRADQVQHDAVPAPEPQPAPRAEAEPAPGEPEPKPAPLVRNEVPSVARRRPSGRTATAPAVVAATPRSASGQASVRPPRTRSARTVRRRAAQPSPLPQAAGSAGETARAPVQVCPVIGRPVCYYGDCHHWSGDRHPDAAGNTGARRSRARRRTPKAVAAAGTVPPPATLGRGTTMANHMAAPTRRYGPAVTGRPGATRRRAGAGAATARR